MIKRVLFEFTEDKGDLFEVTLDFEAKNPIQLKDFGLEMSASNNYERNDSSVKIINTKTGIYERFNVEIEGTVDADMWNQKMYVKFGDRTVYVSEIELDDGLTWFADFGAWSRPMPKE